MVKYSERYNSNGDCLYEDIIVDEEFILYDGESVKCVSLHLINNSNGFMAIFENGYRLIRNSGLVEYLDLNR